MAKQEELEELRVHEELEKERRRDMMREKKRRNDQMRETTSKMNKQQYNQLRVTRGGHKR